MHLAPLSTDSRTDTNTTHTEGRTAVRHETNGHPPDARPDPPDAVLEHRRTEQKALTQVRSSLKDSNLRAEGRP
jgi:hypothetical protein